MCFAGNSTRICFVGKNRIYVSRCSLHYTMLWNKYVRVFPAFINDSLWLCCARVCSSTSHCKKPGHVIGNYLCSVVTLWQNNCIGLIICYSSRIFQIARSRDNSLSSTTHRLIHQHNIRLYLNLFTKTFCGVACPSNPRKKDMFCIISQPWPGQ